MDETGVLKAGIERVRAHLQAGASVLSGRIPSGRKVFGIRALQTSRRKDN